MTNQTVLIVEDDLKIRTLLRNLLEDEGFQTLEADTARDALRLMQSTHITLVTLDIHLGKDNGVDLAREIRRTSQVPIIMLTGKDDVIDRVVGLEVGADDYMTKPFHVRELLARVRSVLRRASGDTNHIHQGETAVPEPSGESRQFRFDELIATPARLELLDRSGADSGLTSGDFKLLTVFLNRPKHVLSRDQLMDMTGGLEWNPLDRTIDNQVARLRKKIERDPADPKLIKTMRGVGYTFACDVQVIHASNISARST
jgi:DNA-binding response OmpR family regulator